MQIRQNVITVQFPLRSKHCIVQLIRAPGAVDWEGLEEYINTLCAGIRICIVRAGGICSYHSVFECELTNVCSGNGRSVLRQVPRVVLSVPVRRPVCEC